MRCVEVWALKAFGPTRERAAKLLLYYLSVYVTLFGVNFDFILQMFPLSPLRILLVLTCYEACEACQFQKQRKTERVSGSDRLVSYSLEKVQRLLRYLLHFRFQREVPRVHKLHLCPREIPLERLSSCWHECRVAFAPDSQ